MNLFHNAKRKWVELVVLVPKHQERQISNEKRINNEEMNEATIKIEKIFDMMDKFTQRILLIYKKLRIKDAGLSQARIRCTPGKIVRRRDLGLKLGNSTVANLSKMFEPYSLTKVITEGPSQLLTTVQWGY
jgi:hypothetical protein